MGHRPQASYLRGLLFTFTIVLSILVAQAQTVTKSPDGNVALKIGNGFAEQIHRAADAGINLQAR